MKRFFACKPHLWLYFVTDRCQNKLWSAIFDMEAVQLVHLATICCTKRNRTCRPPPCTGVGHLLAPWKCSAPLSPHTDLCNMLQFLLILLLRHVRTNSVADCEGLCTGKWLRSDGRCVLVNQVGDFRSLLAELIAYWQTSHSKSLRWPYYFIAKNQTKAKLKPKPKADP